MVFTAYVCDNYELTDSGVLVIFGNYAEFTSNDREMVEQFIDNSSYNAIVCPAIFTDAFGVPAKRILFK
jgi:hypothetical protein